jgi:hypothetical protein
MYIKLIEKLQKKGVITPHALELAKEMEKRDMDVQMMLIVSNMGLLASANGVTPIPEKEMSEITKFLPPHPYFAVKVVAMYTQKFMEDICDGNKLSYIYKKRKNYQEEKKLVGQFYGELMNGIIPLEQMLLDRIADAVWNDDIYFGHLSASSTAGMLAITCIGKEKVIAKLKEGFNKKYIASEAKIYVDDISNHVICDCLEHYLKEEKSMEPNSVVHIVENTCESHLKPMVAKCDNISMTAALGKLIDHTKDIYIHDFLDPNYPN